MQKAKDRLRPTLRRCGQYIQQCNYSRLSPRLGKDNTNTSKPTHSLFRSLSTHLNSTSSSRGQTPPLCGKLEETNSGHVGPKLHPGVQDIIQYGSLISERYPKICNEQGGGIVYITGDSISPGQRCNNSSFVSPQNFFSTIFTVPKKGGERHPIVNLKGLNRFIPHIHFKMEGTQSLRDIVLPGDFMIKLDLKDAYFSIPIHPSHWKFLTFRWKQTFFQFTCLPFGLSSAPRVFTKVMKPVITYLRSLGIRMVVYLDDMLILAHTKEELLKRRSIVLDLLENLGFLINYVKSELEPAQSLILLSFLINTIKMQIRLPKEKISQAVQEAQKLLEAQQASARQLAHLIGVFSATLPAILPAPLHYRGLQLLKHQALRKGGYDVILPLSQEAKDDLLWWIQNLNVVNGQPLVRDQPSLLIETDASLMGWGAVCQEERIGGPWTVEEKALHINCLDWCLQRHLVLIASHIPGKQNVGADLLSRSIVDRHDWMLDPTIFQVINSLWGPLEVDLFASRITKQIPRFFSWKPDPLAEAVDAFKHTWTGFTGYANPPWGLIGRCVQYILQQGATIVLITPLWPGQPWYPTLFPLLLDNPRLLPPSPDLLMSPQGLRFPFPKGANQLVAWYISGNCIKVQESQTRLLPSCLPHGEAQQQKTTTLPGEYGSNGAFSRAPIQFLPL